MFCLLQTYKPSRQLIVIVKSVLLEEMSVDFWNTQINVGNIGRRRGLRTRTPRNLELCEIILFFILENVKCFSFMQNLVCLFICYFSPFMIECSLFAIFQSPCGTQKLIGVTLCWWEVSGNPVILKLQSCFACYIWWNPLMLENWTE